MSNVVNLDDYRPAFVVNTDDGKTHVLPLRLLLDIAEGKRNPADVDDWEPIMRRILVEWMNALLPDNDQ